VWRVLAGALRLSDVMLEAGEISGFHPARAARILLAGREVGAVGEVDPGVIAAYGLAGRVGYFTVSLEAVLAGPRRSDQARPVSRFPASDIDLAFVVPDDVPAAAVQQTLVSSGGELVERVLLFDVYRGPATGEGNRSLAFHVRLRALDRTLTDREVAAVRARVIAAVATAHRGELRG
jgi:phenylalanyl-tRNA synthetase beta chain